jgi:hypothetical protein
VLRVLQALHDRLHSRCACGACPLPALRSRLRDNSLGTFPARGSASDIRIGVFFIPFRVGVGMTFSHSGTLNIVHQLMFITTFLLVTNFIAFIVGAFDISGLWLVPFLILSVLLGVGMAVFYRRSMPPERVQFPRSLPAIYRTVSLDRPVNRGNHLLGVSFLPTICLTRMFWHHRSEQLRGD